MTRPDRRWEPAADTLRVSAPTSGRLVRQASLSSLLVAVTLFAVAVIAASLGQPVPSDAPAGAVGGTLPPWPTEPLVSWIAITPSPGPSVSDEASAAPTSPSPPSAEATPWRTSPPSTCDPYVKPCNPATPHVYPVVYVLITTGVYTDTEIGSGKVTIVADGHTFTCSTYSKPGSCYFEIPAGTPVVATVYTQPGSVCSYFRMDWTDSMAVLHPDCSPISFTMESRKAQLNANFDLILATPSATPTDPPPATPTPTPTPTPMPTPTPTPMPTPTPTPTPTITSEDTPPPS